VPIVSFLAWFIAYKNFLCFIRLINHYVFVFNIRHCVLCTTAGDNSDTVSNRVVVIEGELFININQQLLITQENRFEILFV
jgi:hypothetical protein